MKRESSLTTLVSAILLSVFLIMNSFTAYFYNSMRAENNDLREKVQHLVEVNQYFMESSDADFDTILDINDQLWQAVDEMEYIRQELAVVSQYNIDLEDVTFDLHNRMWQLDDEIELTNLALDNSRKESIRLEDMVFDLEDQLYTSTSQSDVTGDTDSSPITWFQNNEGTIIYLDEIFTPDNIQTLELENSSDINPFYIMNHNLGYPGWMNAAEIFQYIH